MWGDCGVASGSAPVLSKVDVKILLEEAGTILGEVAAESITEIVKNAVSAPKEVPGCVTQATTARTLCLVDLVPLDLVAPCLQKFPEKHGRGPPQGQGRSSDQPTGPQISSPQLSSPSVAPDAPPLQVQELPEVTALGGLCKGGKGIPHDKYWDEIAAALTGDVGSALIVALAGLAHCFEGELPWNPFGLGNFSIQLRESDPVGHIQWLQDNSETLALAASAFDEEAEYSTEQEIFKFVEAIVDWDELVLKQRAEHYPTGMQVNSLSKVSHSIRTFTAYVVDLFPDVDFNLPD